MFLQNFQYLIVVTYLEQTATVPETKVANTIITQKLSHNCTPAQPYHHTLDFLHLTKKCNNNYND